MSVKSPGLFIAILIALCVMGNWYGFQKIIEAIIIGYGALGIYTIIENGKRG